MAVQDMRKVKPLLELEDVSVIFERRQGLFSEPTKIGAVVDVNFGIYPGEVVALVGESGCGKTTLGNVVTGLQKPTHGKLSYNGVDLAKMNKQQLQEFRRGVQMVQQDSYAALNPMRTIYQSLSAPILQKKIVKKKDVFQRVCELLSTVELNPPEQFLYKYPHQLSGGQRQRVLMARAISLNPKIIVADEPVSMIDVSLRISILNLMASLNKKMDIAFIYITHDLSTAKYIAQNGRIAVMYLGKLAEIGNVRQVLANPKHPYLQALLSAVPVPDPKVAKGNRSIPLKNFDMPSPANPPKGCRLHPRCPYAEARCETVEPQLTRVDASEVACHRASEIPAWNLVPAQ
ncbi:oligopeptide/dipeptide ABC transporter ATP-binding protein [Alicyclobacillus fodiniaquatilis]|uniref:Oligopeptide/dipeptide ABC transporter ATP-binding protein n=1 Tax=Alicyclobacillus fodiniaquatilis TaxID=1661150 RepID=A0ABW4JNJ5_9BACL